MTTTQIGDFVAGFVGGFTGHDHHIDFEQCWTDTPDFEQAICTVTHDFGSRDKQKLLEASQLLMQHIHDWMGGLSSCPAAD